MKTRSNMPLFVVECEDVKALSNAQIDLLRCGDYLVKKDASGEHAYKVTYKSATGMCLTYMDASVIETQSYDKIDGVWTYNSEDKTPNLLDLPDESDIKALAKEEVEDATSGTIVNALGLDSNGDLVKGTISGGTQLYNHYIVCQVGGQPFTLNVLCAEGNAPENVQEFYSMFLSSGKFMMSLSSTSMLYPETFNKFFTSNVYVLDSSYDGGSLHLVIKAYSKDTIDITTGNMNTRTATTTINVTSFTDTVTAL